MQPPTSVKRRVPAEIEGLNLGLCPRQDPRSRQKGGQTTKWKEALEQAAGRTGYIITRAVATGSLNQEQFRIEHNSDL